MKLLPAMIIIILVFLGGLIFLKIRRSDASGAWSVRDILRNQTTRMLAIVFLVLLLGLLFKIMGKIALLVGVIIILVSLLTFKRN